MPRLSHEFMEKLRSSTEIEDIIGGYVALRRRGKTLVGLCPFHGEKTASFTVYPESQSFYCFGCGVGGDAIGFISKIENLDYIDAAKFLAERVGIEVPVEQGFDDKEYAEKRAKVLAINKEAANFFFKCLRSSKGAAAVEYVKNRRLKTETVNKYALGFAPNEWHALCDHLKAKGYSLELAREAGLCARGKEGHFYDTFRNRLMFPIIDVRGNVIAFGGRIISKEDGPKYLNSPDTPVFKKSKNLFSLNNAKGTADFLILAEGYMDVISLYQAGFKNAVATLGTAITEEQAALMSRYVSEVVICYDADEAGRKATDRAIEILSKTGIKVRVLRISGGKDPDEFIKEYGAERFEQILKGSGNKTEYKLNEIRGKYNLTIPDEKLSYLKECANVLAALTSPIERDLYAGKLAEELDVAKSAILAEISNVGRQTQRKNNSRAINEEQNRLLGRNDKVNPEKKASLKAAKAEEHIISTLFYKQDMFSAITSEISQDNFVTTFNAKLYSVISEILSSGDVLDAMAIGQYLNSNEMGAFLAIIAKDELVLRDMDAVLICKNILKDHKYKQQLKSLSAIDTDALQDFIRNKKNKGGNSDEQR